MAKKEELHTTRILDGIKNRLNRRPKTCPWRGFDDPLIQDTISLFQMAPNGFGGCNLAQIRQTNPPHYLWEAVQWFQYFNAIIQNHNREQDEKDRERNRGNKGSTNVNKGKQVKSMKGKG